MAEQASGWWSPEEIDESAALINDYFLGQAGREQDVQAILDRYLSGPPNPQTVGLVLDALSIYAGTEVAESLAGYLVYADQYPQLLEEFEENLDDGVAQMLRRWLALYGREMTEAASLRDMEPDAWRLLNREIYFEEIIQTWRVNLQIVKFSGEATDYRETPNSVVILANGVLDTLLKIEEVVGRDALDPDLVADLIATMNQFTQGRTGDAEPAAVTLERSISSDGVS